MTTSAEHRNPSGLVRTVPELCRVCYTCVRECPAKAIRISGGQAEVVGDRCIGCGNCVRVCSQSAKSVASAIESVEALLASGRPVAAMLAPSFPAELVELAPERFVGAIRALGFDIVAEVAFGADLVADEYRQLVQNDDGKRYIATTCPALVAFVEKYHPRLVPNLAPIVSPMVAMARVLRTLHGPDLAIVFIGPCIGKKVEAGELNADVQEALTFHELWMLFVRHGIDPDSSDLASTDPPHGGLGQLFSLSRGMLQAAGIQEDLLNTKVVVADGRTNFVAALKDFESGMLDVRLLEALCCNGCVMGPGITSSEPQFRRRARVAEFARERFSKLNLSRWYAKVDRFMQLDLRRNFSSNDQRVPMPSREDVDAVLARMGKSSHADELNCGACGYDTCQEHAIAILKGLAESEMCLPHTIDRLNSAVNELASAQQALMQSERLASMGQLAAGIAHEINNPLGVVLLYAHTLLEERDEDPRLREDLNMLVEQADRCKKIVSGLLNFARRNKVVRQRVELARLVERCVAAFRPPARVRVAFEHADPCLEAELDPDQLTQAITNLVSNALAAMPDGGTLTLRTSQHGGDAVIEVVDTGVGIPPDHIDKIFEPFFTTKQMGEGTGLGLAVTYGIIKMHRGSIDVRSNSDPKAGPTGTQFRVRLPCRPVDDTTRGRLDNDVSESIDAEASARAPEGARGGLHDGRGPES